MKDINERPLRDKGEQIEALMSMCHLLAHITKHSPTGDEYSFGIKEDLSMAQSAIYSALMGYQQIISENN